MSVEIIKASRVVAQSRNLRGILTYASSRGTYVTRAAIEAERPSGSGTGTLTVEWADGARVVTPFACFSVLAGWLDARRSWSGVRYNPHGMATKRDAF